MPSAIARHSPSRARAWAASSRPSHANAAPKPLVRPSWKSYAVSGWRNKGKSASIMRSWSAERTRLASMPGVRASATLGSVLACTADQPVTLTTPARTRASPISTSSGRAAEVTAPSTNHTEHGWSPPTSSTPVERLAARKTTSSSRGSDSKLACKDDIRAEYRNQAAAAVVFAARTAASQASLRGRTATGARCRVDVRSGAVDCSPPGAPVTRTGRTGRTCCGPGRI